MKKTIVFILSSNFSGSHYLSLLLGSNSKATHVGEVKNLVKHSSLGKKSIGLKESTRQCYICESEQACELTGELSNIKIENIYPTLFSRLPPTTTHLIDASKKTNWAKKFLLNTDYDIKFIHLIRDPRALVRKWNIHYNTPSDLRKQKLKQIRNYPAESIKILSRPPLHTYTLKWVHQNSIIHSFIKSSTKDSRVITYEDLATSPALSISSLMSWLNLEYEELQLDYWEHKHHGTQKPNYDWVKDQKTKFVDTRWKQDLSSREQNQIINTDKVIKLAHNLGVEITNNGLTKNTP